jgi:hypothetical protein
MADNVSGATTSILTNLEAIRSAAYKAGLQFS